MDNKPDTELDLDLDLSKLFLPAWAQEPSTHDHFAKFEGEEEPRKKTGRKFKHQPKRTAQVRKRPTLPHEKEVPKPKPAEPGPQAQPEPLPEVDIEFVPEEKCVESIVRQIKVTGRAYPLFEIARLILQRPERHTVTFTTRKTADGQVVQPLIVCALDDTLWLSEEEVVAYALDAHFGLFYQTERVPADPPKGKYTFVAKCGLSGVILGPPNHHDYQTKLVRLHQERFANIPFEVFKSHIKIVRDEAVVKKWIEEQSWKTQYVCLNVPEPLRLESRQDVEAHFRMVHLPTLVKHVESYTLTGAAARRLKCKGLRRLFHRTYEHQRRFPLQIATALSQRFAAAGLQFFKVNRTITHVSVARPHYLDLETTPVSESVRRIVQFINEHPKCTRRELIEALAPTPPRPIPIAPDTSQQTQTDTPKAEPVPEHTPEQLAVIADLHWLVHQGHVIEFADGRLDTAKKPAPKPPKQKPQPTHAQSEQPQQQLEQAGASTDEYIATAETSAQLEPTEPELENATQPEFEQTGQTTVDTGAEPDLSAEMAVTSADAASDQTELEKETALGTNPQPQNAAEIVQEQSAQPAQHNLESEKAAESDKPSPTTSGPTET